jgi:hypothetical protein
MARSNTVNATPPAPRHPFIWATCVCALATLLLAWPALGGAFLPNPNSDHYSAGYAFREFAANSLRDGHGVPLWNPDLFGGMPYVAAMHGDIFYPTFLLRLLLPTDVARVVPSIVTLDDPTTNATVLNPLFDVKRVAIFATVSTPRRSGAGRKCPGRV